LLGPNQVLKPWLGHHNLLFIKDYATGEQIFRAETEIHLTEKNQGDFERLEALLNGALGPAESREAVDILHRQVNEVSGDEAGKKRARDIFSAAFGLPPKGN